MKAYQKIPILTDFLNHEGVDTMNSQIEENYKQIKLDVKNIVEEELESINEDKNINIRHK